MDKKFLACLINTRDDEPLANAEGTGEDAVTSFVVCLASFVTFVYFLSKIPGNLLVLVDQHAAHERVRLESLVAGKTERQTGDV